MLQSLRTKSQELGKFLKHFENNGFLREIPVDSNKISFGPLGEILLHNLRHEWLFSTVTYREMNVFPYHSDGPLDDKSSLEDLRDGFTSAKFLSGDTVPFGIAFTRRSHHSSSDDPLCPKKHVELKQIIFEKPRISKQFFYRHLQQRKRWWRRFSADPGKFSFSDVKKVEDSSSSEEAQILATFPWGVHQVENVRYLGCEILEKLPITEQNDFAVVADRKRCLPHMIESSVNLDYSVLTYLLDAYSERKSGRPVIRFHRKLAPYKYGFAAGATSAAAAEELYNMSRMICLDLKKEGLSCLFPSPQLLGKKSLDAQLSKNDALGISYTVVLNENSLKTGLCGLYNRETTIQEQTHISKLPEYCVLIMKNY